MANITNKPVSDTERPDPSTPTDGEIATRIQALPQELQDTILSFTDAFNIPAKVRLTEVQHRDRQHPRSFRKCYKLPVALQLNRKLREKFAQEYYSTTVFEFVTDEYDDFDDFRYFEEWMHRGAQKIRANGAYHVALWLQNLSTAHLRMISSLQITALDPYWYDYKSEIDYTAATIRDFLKSAGEHELSVNVVLAAMTVGIDGEEHTVRFDSQGGLLLEGSGLDVATFSVVGFKDRIPDGGR